MSGWAVALCGVLYGITAVDLIRRGDWWMALVFAAYGVANVGLIMKILGR